MCRKDYGEKDFNWNHVYGLDDYTCAFPNWAICMRQYKNLQRVGADNFVGKSILLNFCMQS